MKKLKNIFNFHIYIYTYYIVKPSLTKILFKYSSYNYLQIIAKVDKITNIYYIYFCRSKNIKLKYRTQYYIIFALLYMYISKRLLTSINVYE